MEKTKQIRDVETFRHDIAGILLSFRDCGLIHIDGIYAMAAPAANGDDAEYAAILSEELASVCGGHEWFKDGRAELSTESHLAIIEAVIQAVCLSGNPEHRRKVDAVLDDEQGEAKRDDDFFGRMKDYLAHYTDIAAYESELNDTPTIEIKLTNCKKIRAPTLLVPASFDECLSRVAEYGVAMRYKGMYFGLRTESGHYTQLPCRFTQ